MKKSKLPAKEKVVFDSKETLIMYYLEKLNQLQTALDQLNIQDHPTIIQDVCGEMIEIKNKLLAENLAKWTAAIPSNYTKTSS